MRSKITFPTTDRANRPRAKERLRVSIAARFSALAVIYLLASQTWADAIEMGEIDATLNQSPRMCPSNPATVGDLSYRQHCGDNYMETMSTLDSIHCQNETDAINRRISEYNDFIRTCKAGKGKADAESAAAISKLNSNAKSD